MTSSWAVVSWKRRGDWAGDWSLGRAASKPHPSLWAARRRPSAWAAAARAAPKGRCSSGRHSCCMSQQTGIDRHLAHTLPAVVAAGICILTSRCGMVVAQQQTRQGVCLQQRVGQQCQACQRGAQHSALAAHCRTLGGGVRLFENAEAQRGC